MQKTFFTKIKLRFLKAILIITIVSIGVYFILHNLEKNIVFFYPPSRLNEIKNFKNEIRVGGIVKPDSYIKIPKNGVKFIITDIISEIEVYYEGLLPALFKEGQGIIAKGKLNDDNILIARELLTKHDEYYRPPSNNIK